MEIIKRGTNPQDIEYEMTCSNCKTVIRAKRSECRMSSYQRDGNCLIHLCPICNKEIYHNISQFGR